MNETKFRLAVGAIAIILAPMNTSIAQQPLQTKAVNFVVAAVKPSASRVESISSSSGGLSGGSFQMTNTSLDRWIEMAFSVKKDMLQAPSWVYAAKFDLNAKLPNQVIDEKSRAEMMRSLLIERFGLKWHGESQLVSGFQLKVDKKILAKPSGLLERLSGHGSSSGPSFIGGTNMSMSELAQALEEVVGKPVEDVTQMTGGFEIRLIWRSTDDAVLASQEQYGKQYGVDFQNLPSSVEGALREQLGLRLERKDVPARIIVVDHIDRQPTPN